MACLDTFGLADGGLDFANFHNSVLCKFAKLKIFLTEKKKGAMPLVSYSKFKFAHEVSMIFKFRMWKNS